MATVLKTAEMTVEVTIIITFLALHCAANIHLFHSPVHRIEPATSIHKPELCTYQSRSFLDCSRKCVELSSCASAYFLPVNRTCRLNRAVCGSRNGGIGGESQPLVLTAVAYFVSKQGQCNNTVGTGTMTGNPAASATMGGSTSASAIMTSASTLTSTESTSTLMKSTSTTPKKSTSTTAELPSTTTTTESTTSSTLTELPSTTTSTASNSTPTEFISTTTTIASTTTSTPTASTSNTTESTSTLTKPTSTTAELPSTTTTIASTSTSTPKESTSIPTDSTSSSTTTESTSTSTTTVAESATSELTSTSTTTESATSELTSTSTTTESATSELTPTTTPPPPTTAATTTTTTTTATTSAATTSTRVTTFKAPTELTTCFKDSTGSGKVCYPPTRRHWDQAVAFCHNRQAVLFRDDDAQLHKMLSVHLNNVSMDEIYVNARREGGSLAWKDSEGNALQVNPWVPSYPGDTPTDGPRCAVMVKNNDWDWMHTHCDVTLPFLCHKTQK